jgi:hypothetical protein
MTMHHLEEQLERLYKGKRLIMDIKNMQEKNKLLLIIKG